MGKIWLEIVATFKAQQGTSNLPLVALLLLLLFLACGPFSDVTGDILEPALKHVRRFLR